MPNPIYDIGYRYATQRYTLDGSNIDFEFNFDGGYISEDYVKAFWKKPDLSEEEIDRSDITFVGPNQLRIPIAAAQPLTWKLIIRRDTPKNIPLVDFTDGSILNERNLDKTTTQAIHDTAELVDFIADLLQEWRDLYALAYEAIEDVANLTVVINNLNLLIDDIMNQISIIQELLEDFDFQEILDIANEAHDIAEQAILDAANALSVANSKVEEAPIDGNEYVRKDAAWAIKSSDVGIENFKELSDTFADFTGRDGQILVIDETGDVVDSIPVATIATQVQAASFTELSLVLEGTFEAAEEICRYVCSKPLKIFASASQTHYSYIRVAGSSSWSIDIKKNGTTAGTLSFSTGNTGTFSIASDIDLVAGDYLQFVINTVNATAEDLSITLVCRRA